MKDGDAKQSVRKSCSSGRSRKLSKRWDFDGTFRCGVMSCLFG